MGTLKLILYTYIAIQAVSAAYGLTVITTLKPIVEERLKDRGYEERNRNSLYVFNNKIKSFLLVLVPFYYGYKGLKLTEGKDIINRAADEEIVMGNWITADEQRKLFEQTELEKQRDESLYIPESKILFEKPEPYKARRSDHEIYNLYETPSEYLEKEMEENEQIKITPFKADEPKEIIKVEKIVTERELKASDVARFIADLDVDALDELTDEIEKLKLRLILEKDAA